jgi:hypothetical protein
MLMRMLMRMLTYADVYADAYADVCGVPRTGVGVSRVVDYEKEKGIDFDFKYSFNVSSRFTGIYIYISR